MSGIMDKIITYDQVKFLSNRLRNFEQCTILFRSGCYDMLHIGHIKALQDDKKKADIVVVGIGSDKNISENKRQTLFDQNNRALMIASLSCVDYVVILDEPSENNIDHKQLLKLLKPDYYHIPADDRSIEYKKQLANEIGCKLDIIPLSITTNFGKSLEIHSSHFKLEI